MKALALKGIHTVGSKRLRRLAAIVVLTALATLLAGCTVRFTTIPEGSSDAYVGCSPETESGFGESPLFTPPSTTQLLRFQVVNSDSTQPLEAALIPGGTFGTVWDGTKTTGPQTVPWPQTSSWFLIRITALGDAGPAIHTTWFIQALDGTGNDVGLTCSNPQFCFPGCGGWFGF